MALPKYLEQEIVKLIYAHKRDLLSGVSGGSVTTEFVDSCNFDYGLQFGTITPNIEELPPGDYLGVRNYYKDNLGNYFEQFVLNLNTEEFGGDCSTLVPIYIMQINDALNSSMLSMYMGNGEIELLSNGIMEEINSSMQISSSGVNSYFSNFDGNASFSLNEDSATLSNSTTVGKNSVLNLTKSTFEIKAQDFINGVNVAIEGLDSDSTSYSLAMKATSFLTFQSSFIKVSYDSFADLAKVSMLVPEFADAATAVVAGYSSGDVFRTGELLKIIP